MNQNSTEIIERKIIASLMGMTDCVQIENKLSKLQSKYFQFDKYRNLFEDISSLNAEHILPDAVGIIENFTEKHDEIDLIDIQNAVATTQLIDSYITQLKDSWAKRSFDLVLSNKRIDFSKSLNIEKTADEHILEVQRIKQEIKRINNQSQTQIRTETRKKFETKPDKRMLVPYLMPKVHESINIFRGQIHVIGAESGLGKTATALSFIQHQYRSGINTVFFCCESKAEELLIRLACQKSTNSYSNAVKNFPYGNKDAFLAAIDHFNVYPERLQIYGRDNYRHTVENIDYILWEISQKQRIDMVYIDYFQTLRKENGGKYKKQFEVYEDIIGELTDLAVKYNCAITLLSQLNRERTDDSLPGLMNLKGSSALENAAHIISFLHQKSEDKKNTNLRVKPTVFYSRKTRLIAPFNLMLKYDSYCGMLHDDMEPMAFPWQR